MYFRSLANVIGIALSVAIVHATTIRVPEDYTSIALAVYTATSGDVVSISSSGSPYSEPEIVLKGGVAIVGRTGDPNDVVGMCQ